jgi:hypothetical protein
MSEKHKSTPPSTIQVKNQQKTIGNEEKLDPKLDEQVVETCRKIRLALRIAHAIHDNDNRIKESVRCLDNSKFQLSEKGTVCLCNKSANVLTEYTIPETMGMNLLHFYDIKNKYCIETYVHCTVPLAVQSYTIKNGKGKAIPLQALTGPVGSRLPDF